MNDRSQITGVHHDANGTQHGFVSERGRHRTFTPPGQVESTALGSVQITLMCLSRRRIAARYRLI